jgi:hypothetical protein
MCPLSLDRPEQAASHGRFIEYRTLEGPWAKSVMATSTFYKSTDCGVWIHLLLSALDELLKQTTTSSADDLQALYAAWIVSSFSSCVAGLSGTAGGGPAGAA